MTHKGNPVKLLDGNTVGIDLGTSFSALAHLDEDGDPVVVENANGNPTTASVVVLADGGRVLVGPSPGRVTQADPNRVIVAIKRQMGNANYSIQYEGKRLTPEVISSLILLKLRKDAESQIGSITNAVITVPYYFNEPCRRATRDAGQIAGLNVIDIINEPTAATLAYVWEKGLLGRTDLPDKERTILVYDLGGGTFDVTLVRHTPTRFSVVATDGDTRLGGLDWTQRIANYVGEQFVHKFGFDPREDPRAHNLLRMKCEEAKRELTLSLVVDIVFTYRGQTHTVKMTRYEFERMTSDLLQRTRDTTGFVLENAGIYPEQLDEIVLVGGSSCMPKVQEMLREICGRTPSYILTPQLAVAQGAAIHAAILESKQSGGKSEIANAVMRRLQAVTATDVNSHSLGVEVTDPHDTSKKSNHIMIPKNTKLPFGVKQKFVTTVENPQNVHVRLLEGEAAEIEACAFIGDFRLSNLPEHLVAGSPVELTYSYDDRGRISVTVRELTSNSQASVEINWDGAMNQAAFDSFRALASSYQIE